MTTKNKLKIHMIEEAYSCMQSVIYNLLPDSDERMQALINLKLALNYAKKGLELNCPDYVYFLKDNELIGVYSTREGAEAIKNDLIQDDKECGRWTSSIVHYEILEVMLE